MTSGNAETPAGGTDSAIRNVTIVGGGTAGWLTAALLERFLRMGGPQLPVRITLIESPRIPTVGVGEATVPAMPRLLRQLEIDEAEFITRCNASFKLGVLFDNWNHHSDGGPTRYIHPFDAAPMVRGHNPAIYFHHFADPETDFTDAICPVPAMVRHLKGPRPFDHGEQTRDSGREMPYAYHLDAGRFAEFLKEIATGRGVNHVLDDITDVERGEDGKIAALQLEQGGHWPVELVIDCTGFRGLIIQKAMDEPFQSYGNYLLNDRALAVQLPHEDPTRIEPCTRSTALGAGWSWRVPLYSRVGTGYVFSSAFRSDDEAIREFLDHLGPRAKDAEPRAIAMRVGRSRRVWVENCIAIGLSGGFIEPLESTAIYMIEMAARWLSVYFPDKNYDSALARRYNKQMTELYEEVLDFIVLHYRLSNRTDSEYWLAARNDTELPNGLEENLELWQHALPNEIDVPGNHLFNYWSFIYVLFGKGFFKGRRYPLERALAGEDWARFMQFSEQRRAWALNQLPDHHQLLLHIRGEAPETMRTSPSVAAPPQPGPTHATIPLPGQTFQPQVTFKQPSESGTHLVSCPSWSWPIAAASRFSRQERVGTRPLNTYISECNGLVRPRRGTKALAGKRPRGGFLVAR